MTSQGTESSRWTLDDAADPATIAATYQGALYAQRPRIAKLSIDVVSGQPWPPDVSWAVDALQSRLAAQHDARRLRWLRRRPGSTINLDLRDPESFALAVAISPFTIGGTGLTATGQVIWDGNDTGTSCSFDLTPSEVEQVRRYVGDHGGDPSRLVPLDRRGPVFS